MQAAIWEIIDEPGSYNITSGTFVANGTSNEFAFETDANTYLANVTGGTWLPDSNNVVNEYIPAAGQPANQSFGFLVIDAGGHETPLPEPATLSLLGLGALGLMAVRRRRRSNRQA